MFVIRYVAAEDETYIIGSTNRLKPHMATPAVLFLVYHNSRSHLTKRYVPGETLGSMQCTCTRSCPSPRILIGLKKNTHAANNVWGKVHWQVVGEQVADRHV